MNSLRLMTLLVAVIMSGCHKPPIVIYVVPNGYRGIIQVRAEQPLGQRAKQASGNYVLQVANDGHIDIVEPLPTTDWHQKVIRYRDGTPITNWHNGDGIPADAVVF